MFEHPVGREGAHMNLRTLWYDFIRLVWRCTIGYILFSLLFFCGAGGFLLGGRRFFLGCWRMALYAGRYERWNTSWRLGLHAICRDKQQEPERPNLLSVLLWNVLFGFWLQILFLILAAVCHFVLPILRFDHRMLSLAHGVRNPAYVV